MLEGYIGIYQGTQVFLTERKNYKPIENTYIILEDSLDAIYNGYVVGVYDKDKGTIVFNPKMIKFPFDPITKKIVKEQEKEEVRDNKNEMKLVRTTLYYREEKEEVEKEKNEVEIENSEIENPSDFLEEEEE